MGYVPPRQTVIIAWLLVGLYSFLIFVGSSTSGPDEPVSKPMTEPIIEPIVEPINDRLDEPLPSPGYDKLDHMAEYGLLGALLWLALTMTARQKEAPPWLARRARGWPSNNSLPDSDSEVRTEKEWGSGGLSQHERGHESNDSKPTNRAPTDIFKNFVPPLVLLAALLASLYGGTDELHQSFDSQRDGDWRDWVADTLGGFLGAVFGAFFITKAGRWYLLHQREKQAGPVQD